MRFFRINYGVSRNLLLFLTNKRARPHFPTLLLNYHWSHYINMTTSKKKRGKSILYQPVVRRIVITPTDIFPSFLTETEIKIFFFLV